jgi:hypothetical protein
MQLITFYVHVVRRIEYLESEYDSTTTNVNPMKHSGYYMYHILRHIC